MSRRGHVNAIQVFVVRKVRIVSHLITIDIEQRKASAKCLKPRPVRFVFGLYVIDVDECRPVLLELFGIACRDHQYNRNDIVMIRLVYKRHHVRLHTTAFCACQKIVEAAVEKHIARFFFDNISMETGQKPRRGVSVDTFIHKLPGHFPVQEADPALLFFYTETLCEAVS